MQLSTDWPCLGIITGVAIFSPPLFEHVLSTGNRNGLAGFIILFH
jgi:hypothetical protein